jgi:hypothetical protein
MDYFMHYGHGRTETIKNGGGKRCRCILEHFPEAQQSILNGGDEGITGPMVDYKKLPLQGQTYLPQTKPAICVPTTLRVLFDDMVTLAGGRQGGIREGA